MLAPMLMGKTASELQLMISRKCSNKELWNIKNILVVYKEELEGRKNFLQKELVKILIQNNRIRH